MRRVAIGKYGIPPSEAEALVHDIFIAFLAARNAVRSDLRAYLIAAICNACRNYWRSRQSERRVFVEEGAVDADVLVREDIFANLAVNLGVASTLERIDPRCREALKRYYLDGEDTAMIACALNTSPANVNYIMHVCRKRAREIYSEIARTPR